MVQIRKRILAIGRCAALLTAVGLPAAPQKFYADDPLLREPKPLPVAQPRFRNIDEYFDFFQNSFFPPTKEEMRHHNPSPSEAVNTLGEVPDSPWFHNRAGSRVMTTEEMLRGPGNDRPPATDRPWVVLSAKDEGITPGLVIQDSAGRKYFLKFDPQSNPEMASAADVIGSKFFYALGYHVPENYIVTFPRSQLKLTDKSTIKDAEGHKRPMTERDVNQALKKVPRTPSGDIRGMASLTVPGEVLGPFRYYGTRKDDPNDVVDHEKRRDLRGLSVFCAWLNHTDAKSINSMDSLVEEDGTKFVKHFLIDFGDSLGSDSDQPKDPSRGHVFAVAYTPALVQFVSLGLYAPAWMRANYPDIPAIGNFDSKTFDPETWRSNFPNPAFSLRTPGDEYWAAKKVMAFSDSQIRALVETGRYSDPHAVEWATRCLIERRNRIGRAFFSKVLPLDHFQVQDGKLVFEDLAVHYGFVQQRAYTIRWSTFDNSTSQKTPLASALGFAVPNATAPYLAADIQAGDPRKTVTVYLRSGRVVGIDRTW